MKNKIFYKGLITGVILLANIVPGLARQITPLYVGIPFIIIGGLQVLSSFGCRRYKIVWKIHMGCFLAEILYYVIGTLFFTIMLVAGRLLDTADTYILWVISMGYSLALLIFVLRDLRKMWA